MLLGSSDSRIAAILTPQPMATSAQFVMVKQLALSGCGIDKSGGAWCWGNTQFGILGDGESQVGGSPPVRVSGGLTFREISVGYNDACGVTTTGAVYCWGFTQFGEGGPTNAAGFNATPALVSTPAPFMHISAAAVHTCGIATDGTAYCWGSDADGQLGTTASLANCSGTPCTSSPVAVAGGLQFQSISAGLNATCGLTISGTGYCWGKNDLGQIGDGTQTNRAAPTPIASGGQSLAQITMADRMGCAVTTGSAIECWGYGTQYVTSLVACPVPGSPGSFTSCQPTPTPVATAGLAFSSVALGSGQLCGIPSTPTRLYCWGSGYAGDLGDSSTTNTGTPTLVSDQQ
jgi:alpha-tubulin suppressor-like RCC1 family protein